MPGHSRRARQRSTATALWPKHAWPAPPIYDPAQATLARTLGVSAGSLSRPSAAVVPVDLIEVELDDEPLALAAAHVIVGSPRRRATAIMNAAFVGNDNVAPRAHPGDGMLDVIDFDLSLVDWFKARRRLATGTHVPHPNIATSRTRTWESPRPGPVQVRIDGRLVGRWDRIRCTVRPEAVHLGV